MSISRAAGTLALLTLPLSLAACGGGTSTATSSSATQSSSSTTTSSSDPATSSTSSSSPSSSATSSSSTPSSGADSSKPSKKAATAGLTKILRATRTASKVTPAQADKIAACVVDRAYDKLTAKTLNAMVTGNPKSNPAASDGPVYIAARTYCAQAAGVRVSTSTSTTS